MIIEVILIIKTILLVYNAPDFLMEYENKYLGERTYVAQTLSIAECIKFVQMHERLFNAYASSMSGYEKMTFDSSFIGVCKDKNDPNIVYHKDEFRMGISN